MTLSCMGHRSIHARRTSLFSLSKLKLQKNQVNVVSKSAEKNFNDVINPAERKVTKKREKDAEGRNAARDVDGWKVA